MQPNIMSVVVDLSRRSRRSDVVCWWGMLESKSVLLRVDNLSSPGGGERH